MSLRAVALLLATLGGCVVVLAVGHRPAPVPRAPTRNESTLGVLHGWDERRAAAYASGSATALRELYLPGSAAAEADVRMLHAYRARGLRVTGMRMQVLGFSVLESRPGWRRLRVTDRLVGATAVHDGRRLTLPRDLPSTRTLTMMRGDDGRWRVADVTEAGL